MREKIIRDRAILTIQRGGISFFSTASSLLSINTAEVDRHLPTAATMCEQFDGVPFYKLPVVHIKATPNNTIMHTFNVVNVCKGGKAGSEDSLPVCFEVVTWLKCL